MPLIKSKSKNAFSKNVEAEMHAGKPQDQALAIAYSVKRKTKKKMAEGGTVSAATEKRPMPDNTYDDAAMAKRNSGNKQPKNDSWTDSPTITQAQSNSGRMVKPIAGPRMVPSNAFSTRLYDKEGNLQESAKPGPYGAKPESDENEVGADRQGLDVSDMASEHNNGKRPYNKAIEDQYAADVAEANMKRDSSYAQGGPVMQPKDHGTELKERDEEAHLMIGVDPSEDEGRSMADGLDEEDDRQGPAVSDMEDEHSTHRKPYAGGGEISDDEANIDDDMELNPAHDKHTMDDSEDQPEDEEEIEHADSVAAAIMSKRKKMAEGGEVDLSINADEEPNHEDEMSFQALKKENYSETAGLDDLGDQPHDSNLTGDDEEHDSENAHDMVSKIRAKMQKRQFSVR